MAVLSGIVLIVGGVHLAYWFALHRGLQQAQARDTADRREAVPPMSIIVAARNEEKVLPDLLRALTAQTHPRFEIIVVDDASSDATVQVARRWAARHSALRIVQVDPSASKHKKAALRRGIQAARYELLAFTDADCAPPPGWLEALARRHAGTSRDTLLIGYSPCRRHAGTLNRLVAYETFVTGALTAAAVGLGRPYMAVGRNMSYPKAVFERVGGYAHSKHFLCGDDDLFVQEVVRQNAAAVQHMFDPQAVVPTEAPATWRGWLRQKRRHAAAGRHYDADVQLHLALFQGTGVLLWAAPLWAGWLGLGALTVKLAGQGFVLRQGSDVLGEPHLRPSWPYADLLYAAYNLFVAPWGLTRAPDRW